VFELAGFECVRVEGDHFVLTRPGLPRPLVIPDYDAVPVFIIRNNLRTAGISRGEYFRLLAAGVVHDPLSHRFRPRVPARLTAAPP